MTKHNKKRSNSKKGKKGYSLNDILLETDNIEWIDSDIDREYIDINDANFARDNKDTSVSLGSLETLELVEEVVTEKPQRKKRVESVKAEDLKSRLILLFIPMILLTKQ